MDKNIWLIIDLAMLLSIGIFKYNGFKIILVNNQHTVKSKHNKKEIDFDIVLKLLLNISKILLRISENLFLCIKMIKVNVIYQFCRLYILKIRLDLIYTQSISSILR